MVQRKQLPGFYYLNTCRLSCFKIQTTKWSDLFFTQSVVEFFLFQPKFIIFQISPTDVFQRSKHIYDVSSTTVLFQLIAVMLLTLVGTLCACYSICWYMDESVTMQNLHTAAPYDDMCNAIFRWMKLNASSCKSNKYKIVWMHLLLGMSPSLYNLYFSHRFSLLPHDSIVITQCNKIFMMKLKFIMNGNTMIESNFISVVGIKFNRNHLRDEIFGNLIHLEITYFIIGLSFADGICFYFQEEFHKAWLKNCCTVSDVNNS